MNLNPENIFYWQIWLDDGRVITRPQNLTAQNTPTHIDPENPPCQANKIAWISVDGKYMDRYCPIPTGARPICFWRPARDMGDINNIMAIKFFLGFELNGQRIYRVIEIPENIDRLEIRQAKGEIV